VPPLHALRQDNRRKYKETLNFMQEWTSDLMERESELEQQRQDYFVRMLKERNETALENGSGNRLNLEKLIKEEFLKKMESLYIKQLMMANITDRSAPEETPHDVEDSLNRSQQTYTEEHHYFDRENPSASANFD
jgi:hypothetical protein